MDGFQGQSECWLVRDEVWDGLQGQRLARAGRSIDCRTVLPSIHHLLLFPGNSSLSATRCRSRCGWAPTGIKCRTR